MEKNLCLVIQLWNGITAMKIEIWIIWLFSCTINTGSPCVMMAIETRISAANVDYNVTCSYNLATAIPAVPVAIVKQGLQIVKGDIFATSCQLPTTKVNSFQG